MRGIRSTLILFVIALGLGLYIYFIESERPTSVAQAELEQVFPFESDDVTRLAVTAETGERTVIEKTEDRWHLSEPFDGNVDVTKAVSLSSSLATLELQRVVAEPEDAPDLSIFGLAEPRIIVGVTTETDEQQLLIGDRTPTGNDLYATVGDSDRIFLISGFLDSTFNQTTFDLRDKTILNITRDQVDGLEISGDQLNIQLRKTESQWALVRPIAAHTDLGATDGIVGQLSTGQMSSVEEENADDLEPYGLDTPTLSISVGLGSSTATLLLGTPTSMGTVYARDASRDLVFTVDQSLVTELRQGVEAYRRRDLFTFRPFNATALELDVEGERWNFEKVEATGEEETDSWRRTSPDTETVDQGPMDDLLAKFSNLRAESFEPTRDNTGLETPIATVRVTYDDTGSVEQVTIGRVEENVFAINGNEPGAARLNTRSWEDAIDALLPLSSRSDDDEGTP